MDLQQPPIAKTKMLQQGAFVPLQQDVFARLQHAPFYKGLLKPFKGKGELEQLAAQCQALEAELNTLAQERVLAQVQRYPFTLLPIRLVTQRTSAGPVFLRWKQSGTRRMGVELWEQLSQDTRLSPATLADLHAIELQRIALNMQISLVHSIGRQAAECAEKMAQASAVYHRQLKQISKAATEQPATTNSSTLEDV